jgi:hypothetical protein
MNRQLPRAMDDRVARLETPEECAAFAKNATALGRPDLALAARNRAVQLRAAAFGATSEVERECIEAVFAYEEVLSARAGHRQPASRTWPMIERHGIIEAVERVVKRKADALGYTALVEMGLKEHAFEAVILRHPSAFSPEAVKRSKERLDEQSGSEPFSAIFKQEPTQWGLRGDPFLWRDMKQALSGQPLPATEDQFIALVETTFQRLTGAPMSSEVAIYVEKYAHGGMSSGHVDPEFWRELALPQLRSRYAKHVSRGK